MTDPFKSARLKIARAKKHIDDLHVLIERFKAEANNSYEIVIEDDPEPGYKVHKFRLLEAVPYDDLSIIMGDALNNIRAALDHIVYACAITNRHAIPPFKTCSFPFGKDAKSFTNAVNGCTAVHADIRACLSRFNAYDGGNTSLWTLNSMCNRDKHALITTALTGFDDIWLDIRTGAVEMPGPTGWDNVKHEINLFRTKQDPDYEFHYSVEMTFNGPPYLTGNRIRSSL